MTNLGLHLLIFTFIRNSDTSQFPFIEDVCHQQLAHLRSTSTGVVTDQRGHLAFWESFSKLLGEKIVWICSWSYALKPSFLRARFSRSE